MKIGTPHTHTNTIYYKYILLLIEWTSRFRLPHPNIGASGVFSNRLSNVIYLFWIFRNMRVPDLPIVYQLDTIYMWSNLLTISIYVTGLLCIRMPVFLCKNSRFIGQLNTTGRVVILPTYADDGIKRFLILILSNYFQIFSEWRLNLYDWRIIEQAPAFKYLFMRLGEMEVLKSNEIKEY